MFKTYIKQKKRKLNENRGKIDEFYENRGFIILLKYRRICNMHH